MSETTMSGATYTDAIRGALQAVQAFSDAMDRMHGDVKGDMGMNSTDLAALRMLVLHERQGQTVSPHDFARHLRISSASTSKMLDRLAAAGHIERRAHPHDGRGRIVVLTDESRRAFFTHFGVRLQAMRGVAEKYSDDELRTITRFIDEICLVADPQ